MIHPICTVKLFESYYVHYYRIIHVSFRKENTAEEKAGCDSNSDDGDYFVSKANRDQTRIR